MQDSQFHLRDVFIVLTVTAVVLAVAAPWLRAVTAKQWGGIFGCVAVGMFSSVSAMLVWHWNYSRMVRAAGTLVWQTTGDERTQLWFRLSPIRVLLLAIVPMLGLAPLFYGIYLGREIQLDLVTLINVMNSLIVTIVGSRFVLDDYRQVFVGTRGVVVGLSPMLWKHLRLSEANPSRLTLKFSYWGTPIMLECPSEELRDQALAAFEAATR